MTKQDRSELMTLVANLAMHCADFPEPTPVEKELLKTIDFLCAAFMTVVDDEH